MDVIQIFRDRDSLLFDSGICLLKKNLENNKKSSKIITNYVSGQSFQFFYTLENFSIFKLEKIHIT